MAAGLLTGFLGQNAAFAATSTVTTTVNPNGDVVITIDAGLGSDEQDLTSPNLTTTLPPGASATVSHPTPNPDLIYTITIVGLPPGNYDLRFEQHYYYTGGKNPVQRTLVTHAIFTK